MTDAAIGLGVTLARGDGASPETFTEIAELIEVTPPSLTKDQVEATHTNSPNGFREYIPGLKDGGEFTARCNFLPNNATQDNTSQGALNDFLSVDTAVNWRITFPGSPNMVWTFGAVVTAYQPEIPLDDRMVLNLTFKVTGAPTVT